MAAVINRFSQWLDLKLARFGRARSWIWFALLWCLGLGSVLLLSLPIKWLVQLAESAQT